MNTIRIVHATAAVLMASVPSIPRTAFARHDVSPAEFAARTQAPRRVNASQIAAFRRPARRAPQALV